MKLTYENVLSQKELDEIREGFNKEYEKNLQIFKDGLNINDISEIEKMDANLKRYAQEDYRKIALFRILIDLVFHSPNSHSYLYESIHSEAFKEIPDDFYNTLSEDEADDNEDDFVDFPLIFTDILDELNEKNRSGNQFTDEEIDKIIRRINMGINIGISSRAEAKFILETLGNLKNKTINTEEAVNAIVSKMKKEKSVQNDIEIPKIIIKDSESINSIFTAIEAVKDKKYLDTDSRNLDSFTKTPEYYQKAVNDIVSLYYFPDKYFENYEVKRTLKEIKNIFEDFQKIKKRLTDSESKLYTEMIKNNCNEFKEKLAELEEKEDKLSFEVENQSFFKRLVNRNAAFDNLLSVSREKVFVKMKYDYMNIFNEYLFNNKYNIYEIYKFIKTNWNETLTIYESYIDECDSDNYSDFFDNYVSPVNDFLKNTAISEASLHIDEFVGFVNLFIYKLMIDY